MTDRYAVRELPPEQRRDGLTFGLYDTTADAFVVGGGHFRARAVAEAQARRYNAAWVRAKQP